MWTRWNVAFWFVSVGGHDQTFRENSIFMEVFIENGKINNKLPPCRFISSGKILPLHCREKPTTIPRGIIYNLLCWNCFIETLSHKTTRKLKATSTYLNSTGPGKKMPSLVSPSCHTNGISMGEVFKYTKMTSPDLDTICVYYRPVFWSNKEELLSHLLQTLRFNKAT